MIEDYLGNKWRLDKRNRIFRNGVYVARGLSDGMVYFNGGEDLADEIHDYLGSACSPEFDFREALDPDDGYSPLRHTERVVEGE